MVKSPIRGTRRASPDPPVSDDGVDLTRIDGVDAYTPQRDWHGTKWPSAKHFASWLGLSPNNRVTGGKVQLKDQAQRQPGCGALRLAANALHRSQRPGRVPAPEESPPGSAQGAPAGPHHLHHTAKRTWMPARNTTRDSISSGPCVRPSVGRPNWATNWCPCPTPGTAPRTHLPVRQSPRDNVG